MLLSAAIFALVLGAALSAPHSNNQQQHHHHHHGHSNNQQMEPNPLLGANVLEQVKQGFLCDWCIISIGDSQQDLKENFNMTLGILERISRLCEFCPVTDQCQQVFLNDIPAALQDYLAESPEAVCTEAGLCDMNATLTGMLMSNPNQNVAIDRVAIGVLTKAREIQQNLIRTFLGQNYLCDTCQEFITTTRAILLNNETQYEVMNFVGSLCNYMPTELQTDCDTFVQSLPSLMEMLAKDVLLDSTCSELGFCNKTMKPETPVDALPEITDFVQGVLDGFLGGDAQGGGVTDLSGILEGVLGAGGQGGGTPDFSGILEGVLGAGGQGGGIPDFSGILEGVLGAGGQGGGIPDRSGILEGVLGGGGQGRGGMFSVGGGGRGATPRIEVPSVGGRTPYQGQGWSRPRQEPQQPQHGSGTGYGWGKPSNAGRPGNGRPQHPSPNINPWPQKPRPNTPKPADKPNNQLGDIMSGILDKVQDVQTIDLPRFNLNWFGGRKRRAVPKDFPKGFKDKVQDMLPELLPQKDKVHQYIPDPLPDAGITITERIPMTGAEQCEVCKLAVVAVDNWLTDNAPQLQKMVSQFALPFCTVFPSPMKEDCVSDVSEFVQTFIQVLVSKLQPEPICTWLGQCDATMGPVVPDVPLLPTETPRVEPGTTWPMFP